MLPLFDLMMNAQNGEAMATMAKQFGLAQEQMRDAMAALMPAFSTGLKRTATNPYDFSNLMSTAASGGYAKYFEDMAKAFSPQGVTDGNAILGQIFGSKEVSRAVAAQAAQMSGIGQDIFKQMMPIVANAMVGGFFKQMAEQFQSAGNAFSQGKAPDVMQQWMQATGMAEKPQAQQNPFDNPFMQAFQAMFTPGGSQATPATGGQDPFASNPFLQAYASMMKPPVEKEPEKPAATENNPLASVMSQMFDSGIEVQRSYQKSMDDIFATYMSGMKSESPKN